MGATLTISTRDLHRLREVTDRAHLAGTDEPMPPTVLQALNELVPCDQVTYEVLNPVRREWGRSLDLYVNFCFSLPDDFFWPAFWASRVCSYPQRSGDRTSVVRSSDFYSRREFGASVTGELFRIQEARYNAVLPLVADGDFDHRIEFWREGSDFSDREVMLLGLLRPHLAEFELAARARRDAEVLTVRQIELLKLVAAGMTNRQVGRRLDISEGTVRRHLENIYERLSVSNRAAASAYIVGVSGERSSSQDQGG